MDPNNSVIRRLWCIIFYFQKGVWIGDFNCCILTFDVKKCWEKLLLLTDTVLRQPWRKRSLWVNLRWRIQKKHQNTWWQPRMLALMENSRPDIIRLALIYSQIVLFFLVSLKITVNVVIVFGLNIWTAYSIFILKFKHNHMPDTQLDVNPTWSGDRGFDSRRVSNILSWRLIMKYFLRSFSPFCWFKKDSCQFLAKECAQYWLTA